MYRVLVVDNVEGFEGSAELLGFETAETANARARQEAADTVEAMAGGWIIARESMAGGLYGARLESPNVSGFIRVMVQRHG